MKIRPGQFYLLHSGHVAEIEEVSDTRIKYNVNGGPADVLRVHFMSFIKRRWTPPLKRKERRRKWTTSI